MFYLDYELPVNYPVLRVSILLFYAPITKFLIQQVAWAACVCVPSCVVLPIIFWECEGDFPGILERRWVLSPERWSCSEYRSRQKTTYLRRKNLPRISHTNTLYEVIHEGRLISTTLTSFKFDNTNFSWHLLKYL